MDLGLKGKRALVMGASRGIGRAIAGALVQEGARVAVSARNKERTEAAAKELGGIAIVGDLSQRGVAAGAVGRTIEALGGIDILVVNTGGPPPTTFESTSEEQWRASFEALWISAVASIQAALVSMRQQKSGRILVVTSIAAKEPLRNLTVSNGLRAGLHGLVKSLSREVAKDHITVNAIMPGYTLTERLVEAKIDFESLRSMIPMERVADPAEFAALATFLASEQAGYITGQAIACDGGVQQSI